MSYCVRLTDNGSNVQVPEHSSGAVFPYGGTTEAIINITYNYGVVYRIIDVSFPGQVIPSYFTIKSLNNRKAKETIEVLSYMVSKLGTTEYKDYWAPTPGNAGIALNILLNWAGLHPDATWSVF